MTEGERVAAAKAFLEGALRPFVGREVTDELRDEISAAVAEAARERPDLFPGFFGRGRG